MSAAELPRVGVIGLGAMGMGMATSLASKGFAVTAFDLSTEACAHAAAAGIATPGNVLSVFANADQILISLPNARIVEAVLQEAAPELTADSPSRIIIDASTSEVEVSRKLAAELAENGHGFIDAPVSGGPSGAAAGSLAVMAGGEEVFFNRALSVLEAIATKILHVGPSGAGNVAKLVNNMLVACHMQTTREALKLSEAAGVKAEDALRVINSATGRSAISEIHFPNWVLPASFDSGFSAGLMRKDVRLALELAETSGCNLPMASLTKSLWSEANTGIADTEDFMLAGDYRSAKSKLKDEA